MVIQYKVKQCKACCKTSKANANNARILFLSTVSVQHRKPRVVKKTQNK